MSEPEAVSETLRCPSCGDDASLEPASCGCGGSLDTLQRVSDYALEHLEHGDKITLPPEAVDEPTESGFHRSRLGRRKGQSADYRMPASTLKEGDGRELHLRVYTDRYTLHVDKHPARNPRHAVDDAPEVAAAGVAAFAAVGLTAAASFLRKRNADRRT